MSKHVADSRRVGYLAERLKEDALTESEQAELQDIIRNQPEARKYLVELLYLSVELRDVVSHWTDQDFNIKSNVIYGWFTKSAIAGLAAVIALTFFLWRPWGGEPSSPVSVADGIMTEEQLDAEGVAVVSRLSGVHWGEGTTLSIPRVENGSPLGAGVMEILKGLVQIDFYSGATVIIEGPAKMVIESADQGRLIYGNLWAHVPPPARGFKILTEAFDVVDLGTEIGVSVNRDGEGEVHVLDGEVEVFSNVDGEQQDKLLQTGEGVEVNKDGVQKSITARADDFAVAARLSGEAQGRFQQWKDSQQLWREDPGVIVSYDFDGGSAWDSTVKNMSTSALPDTEGAVVGCKRVEGRWPGKQALEFRNSSNRVRLNVPGEYKDITLSCWLRLDAVDSPEISLFHPETKQDRYLHWTLVNVKPGIVHLHFSETTKAKGGKAERNHYHSTWNLLSKKHGVALGEWMHLASVYDSEKKQVRHYQNGKNIGVSEIKDPRPLGIGNADIGNWPYHAWAKGTKWEVRNLNGAIDEFMIAKRVLEPDEIEAIWKVGRP
ncbi:LamG-like jellyroll fold domain-containing protein [Rubellicoccus peritrichatus]|uniref:LamG-like jellyroll fold domain-containing protein n=1 Tax=Rubellicoccus peritrichatus TaxID=3080537 RepID=A0AAQ3L7V4_9BACT|nr:LamG-like jellyroll fold domain-containing protein [Puniceicoccus sp. CR14]WOO40880.1 LamG-like jellyroll fold domain-containing protein [Puniceicoccus sp. CR14]